MRWFEFFDILNEIVSILGDNNDITISTRNNGILRIRKSNAVVYVSVYDGDNSYIATYSISNTKIGIIEHTYPIKSIDIENYKKYYDDTEITLAIGRVIDYSILRNIMKEQNEYLA